MTTDELDDALCIVSANCDFGWIPRQVATKAIKAEFAALQRRIARLEAVIVPPPSEDTGRGAADGR